MRRDLYARFVSGVLFPVHERLKNHATIARLRELEKSQWWSTERLMALQQERLRAFLAQVGATVPYYRDLFASHGVSPREWRGASDLGRLPFLTKALIREHGAALAAEGASDLRAVSTGGSTGEPLRFRVGPARVSSDVALRQRSNRWWGVDVGDREAVLWGSHIEVTRQDRMRTFRDRLFRSTLLSVNHMTTDVLDRYLDDVRRLRPVQIFSHPSALDELARRADERGVRLDGLGIRVIFLTAEELYQHQRERIERVFGCRAVNGYGGRDSGFIAQECPEGAMHVNVEDILVEIVGDTGESLPVGSSGEIVVTHLRSEEYPFVRYRTGDVGVLGAAPCACGRGLPVLREVHGRADDLLLGLDGARVPGQVVVLLFRDLPGIAAFKVVQEEVDRVRILLVRTAEFSEAAAATIREGFQARLGAAMRVEVQMVDSIPREASGKYRTVVSLVGSSPAREAERRRGDGRAG